MAGELPGDWDEKANAFIAEVNRQGREDRLAVRRPRTALNGYGPLLPEFLGGSADSGRLEPDHLVRL